MLNPALPKPTDAELEILRVLWKQGPATVRQVHQLLASQREIGYTTVLKLLQIMAQKGLVTRDATQRSHVYQAAQSESDTQGRLVKDLLSKAFDGSTEKLVLRALSTQKASAEELAQIRRLLDQFEGESK